MEKLSELPITIEYKTGPLHMVSDALSRQPDYERDATDYLSRDNCSIAKAWLQRAAP